MGALDGKVAIVTGAGRGVGRGTALSLAQHGATVLVADIGVEMDGSQPRNTEADGVVAEIKAGGGNASASYTDVANFQQVEAMVEGAVKQYGRIDIVVSHAGIVRRKMVWELDEDDWDAVLDVHLKGTFACMRFAIPHMIEQKWGRIVNTLSPAGIVQGAARRGNYGAAKGGIYALTQSAAVELAGTGVTVNAVCPSTSDTRLLRTSIEEVMQGADSPQTRAIISAIKPTPPEDVAPITTYLCTEEAADITGKFFYSNGGEIQTLQPIQYKPLLNKDGRWELDELTEAMRGVKDSI